MTGKASFAGRVGRGDLAVTGLAAWQGPLTIAPSRGRPGSAPACLLRVANRPRLGCEPAKIGLSERGRPEARRPAAEASISGGPPFRLESDRDVREAYEAYGAGIYRFAVRALHIPPASPRRSCRTPSCGPGELAHRYDSAAGSPRTWLFAIAEQRCRRPGAGACSTAEGAPSSADETGFVDDPSEHVHRSWQVEEAARAAVRRSPVRRRRDTPSTSVRAAMSPSSLGVPEGTVRSLVATTRCRALDFALTDRGYERWPGNACGDRRELLALRRRSAELPADR